MLYLYKPHVTGPEGAVTSPDIVVDCLIVDGARRPLAMLSMIAWQQVAGEDSAQAGYGVMALGGGALLLPAVVLSSGLVVVARGAWRLNNLDGHIGQVVLNGAPLSALGLPAAEIEAAGGTGDALPRGYMVVRTAPGATWQAVLEDPARGRALAHRVVPEDLDSDRWGTARPRPRYSVGPTQKEITHYI